MRKDRSGDDSEPRDAGMPLALAGLLGSVGCVTLVVIFVALGIGLWLDLQFETRPLFTVILVLASIPVTIFLMVRIVLGGMERINRRMGVQDTPQVRDGSRNDA